MQSGIDTCQSKHMHPLLIGILLTGYVPAGSGGADGGLYFDGRGAHLSTRNLPFGSYSQLTIEVWYRNWQGPLLCQGQAGDPENSIWMSAGKPGQPRPEDASGWESSTGTNYQFNSGPGQPSKWNHLALVYDGTEQRIFLNGSLKHRTTAPKPGPFHTDRTLFIGLHDYGKRRIYGTGLLRSVRISSTARYSRTFEPADRFAVDAQTVLLYDLSRDLGNQTVADLSPGRRAATQQGTRWTAADGAGMPAGGNTQTTEQRAPAPVKVKPGPVGAAGIRALSRHLEAVRSRHELPAMAAAILVDGRHVLTAAVGERKLGSGVEVTTNDRFHLGSCTKAMTALLIERLAEEGHFQKRARVADLSPRLGLRMHEDLADLTLEHCLVHRGGFVPTDMTFDDIPENSLNLQGARARFDYARRMVARPPRCQPGARYEYSNVGHTIAAVIAEEKMKHSWELLMKKYVFAPLDMTTVGYGAAGSGDRIDQPWPHKADGEKQTPLRPGPGADNAELIGPAARIHCSMGDWAKFAVEILRAGERNRDEPPGLLSPSAYRRLLTPPFGAPGFGYAGGWSVAKSWTDGETLSHDGTNTLNFAHAWLLPRRKFGVLVATNSGISSARNACRELRTRIAADWLYGGLSSEELSKEYRRASDIREWIRRLQQNRIKDVRSRLSPEVFDYLTSDRGQSMCTALGRQGQQKRMEFLTQQTRGNRTFSVYRLTFDQSVWRLEYAHDDRRRVTWLQVQTPFEASP